MEKKHLYRQIPWSFKKYLLKYWNFWLILFSIVSLATALFYYLSTKNYFSHEEIQKKNQDIGILVFRSDIFTTVVVTNPFDFDKPYEIDLGFKCIAKTHLLNQKVKMQAVLYRRNYNKTFFVDFPEARKTICN